MTERAVFPVWVLRRDAKVGGDGVLWYNNFGCPRLTQRERTEVKATLDRLRRAISAGRDPAWRGGRRLARRRRRPASQRRRHDRPSGHEAMV
jgi:hypothetical protein